LLSAEPDAAVVAVALPGVVVQRDAFGAVSEASARPAESALEALQRVSVAAVEPRLAFAPIPERPALFRGPEPNRQISAVLRATLAHSFPALSDRRQPRGDQGAAAPGGAVPGRFEGTSFALGFVTPGTGPVAPEGTGGAPFVPGTGRALAFGNAWP
jgi:hypothetical protein